MIKQLALSITLLVFMGHLAGVTRAQSNMDQKVSELSKQISDGLTENQKRTIAVVEFIDLKGNVTDFGRFLAEELITRLYQTKKFKVIERQLLNKILSEQKLSLTGIIDQTSAQKLGKLLGVDAIAAGTVTDLGKSIKVNARLINTSTGEIFAVASTEFAKDESVMKLMGSGDTSPTGTDTKVPAGPHSSAQSQRSVQRVDAQFLTFELLQCRMSGSSITCDWRVTNNDQDRMFKLDTYDSRLYDELGNGYRGATGQVANQSGNSPEIGFISGVTTSARMTFQEVSPQATKITVLRLRYAIGGGTWSDAQFRDVPLVRIGSR